MYGRDLSIDTPQAEGDAAFTLHDRLDSGEDTVEELLESEQARQLRNGELAKALEGLDERERHIVVARHLDESPLTLRELGGRHGNLERESSAVGKPSPEGPAQQPDGQPQPGKPSSPNTPLPLLPHTNPLHLVLQ